MAMEPNKHALSEEQHHDDQPSSKQKRGDDDEPSSKQHGDDAEPAVAKQNKRSKPQHEDNDDQPSSKQQRGNDDQPSSKQHNGDDDERPMTKLSKQQHDDDQPSSQHQHSTDDEAPVGKRSEQQHDDNGDQPSSKQQEEDEVKPGSKQQRTDDDQPHVAKRCKQQGEDESKPAAQTPASKQQYDDASAAWSILLQHDSLATQQLRLFRRLLCCNKELSATVAAHCAGRLTMDASLNKLPGAVQDQQVAPWLRKHGLLLRQVDLSNARPSIAAAMVAAATTLRLQALDANSSTALPLLERLRAPLLTRLDLCVGDRSAGVAAASSSCPATAPTKAHSDRVSAALGRLTALKTLKLTARQLPAAAFSSLRQLSALRSLSYSGPVAGLQYAPVQLLDLSLVELSRLGLRWEVLDLRHLTALTSLADRHTWGQPVQPQDLLPPGLLRLDITSDRSIRALHPQQKLQDLSHIVHKDRGGDISAAELSRLSSLTALELGDADVDKESPNPLVPPSFPSWPLLPLKTFTLRKRQLSLEVCQSMRQLTGLTRLSLQVCSLTALPRDLAAALQQMPGLQALELLGVVVDETAAERVLIEQETAAGRPGPVHHYGYGYIGGEEWDDGVDSHEWGERLRLFVNEGMAQLVRAVGGGLPQLCKLHVRKVKGFAAAAELNSLTGLARLTELHLLDCGVSGESVAALMPIVSGLKSLSISCSALLTDGALAAVGQLRQLTALKLGGTGVTDVGLQHLSGLRRLQMLELGSATSVTHAGLASLSCLTAGGACQLITPWSGLLQVFGRGRHAATYS